MQRLTIGKWLAASGIAIAALGGVPAVLGAPAVGWGLLIVGLVTALIGGIFALLGATPEERRAAEHERVVKRNELENERDELAARQVQIDGELGKRAYWAGVATNYGSDLRSGEIAGEVAIFEAERAAAERRLAQIDHELGSL